MKRRRTRRFDRKMTKKTILWLVCCFPIGLTMMWRKNCRWPVGVKYVVSACMAILLVAVILPQTAPVRSEKSGVEYVLSEPSVKVHGPELPSALQEHPVDYESVLHVGNVTPAPTIAPATETYVYATISSKLYHTTDCRRFCYSAHKYTLYEAHFSGYQPCDLCNPGVYGQ
jgi:hypothetical protein